MDRGPTRILARSTLLRVSTPRLKAFDVPGCGVAAFVERFDHCLMVVVNVSVLQRVAARVWFDDCVAREPIHSFGVADASEIDDPDIIDPAVHGLMGMAAEHEISRAPLEHRTKRVVGQPERESFAII